MPRCGDVEKTIYEIEQFKVTICNADGSNIRGDKKLHHRYPYTKKAHDSFTVNEWIEKRFNKHFEGYTVLVKMKDGSVASGQTKLKTVRDSYYV